jgi:hypothetical protein
MTREEVKLSVRLSRIAAAGFHVRRPNSLSTAKVGERSIACVSPSGSAQRGATLPEDLRAEGGLTGGIDFVENSDNSSFRQIRPRQLFCGILIPQLATIDAVFQRPASNSRMAPRRGRCLGDEPTLTFYTSRICTATGAFKSSFGSAVTPADRLPRWRAVATTLASRLLYPK